jgi:hypothetical protein
MNKPTTLRRRSLLVSLVVLAGLAGTASEWPDAAEFIAGYFWEADPQAPVCEQVTWKKVERDRIPGLCSDARNAAEGVAACVMECLVISAYSEQEAKHVYVYGESLFSHEMRHVKERKVHP